MKIHRFYIDIDLKGELINITDKELLNQLKKVLKLNIGESIAIFNGKGEEVVAEIKELQLNSCTVKINKLIKNKNISKNYVILYCSILKRDNFELVVQKATELGINEIVPIVSHRTVKFDLKRDRLIKIIKEASEQSGRITLPVLEDKILFKESVSNSSKLNDINIFFDSSGKKIDIEKIVPAKTKVKRVGIYIGPEGGWDDDELKLAKSKNFKVVSLGETTLRAETAAITSSFLAVNLSLE